MRTRLEFKSKSDGTFKDYECPVCRSLPPTNHFSVSPIEKLTLKFSVSETEKCPKETLDS